MMKYLISIMLLFTVLSWSDTYCSAYIDKWQDASKIVVPVYACLALPFWFTWRRLYQITGNMWQVGIIAAIPVALGVWTGTYLAVRTLPSKMQVAGILINLVAVFISKL